MKKLRNIIVAICLMLCTVVLASCGGGQLSTEAGVSKKGLKAATKEDYTTFAEGKEFKADGFTSYRVTVTEESKEGKVYQNAIVTTNDKGELDGIAMKYVITEGENKITMEIYYTDGTMYLHFDNGTDEIKYKLPADKIEEAGLGELFSDVINDDFSMFLSQFESYIGSEEEGLVIEKAGKGDNVRFHVGLTEEIPAEEEEEVSAGELSTDVYVEFKGEQLVGFEMKMVYDGNTLIGAYETFSGKIKFPSFKKYTDPDLTKLATLLAGLMGDVTE